MGSSLQWLAYFDNVTKVWSLYDPTGTFDPAVIWPPVSSDYPFGELTYVFPSDLYLVSISPEVDYRGVKWEEGILQVVWPQP